MSKKEAGNSTVDDLWSARIEHWKETQRVEVAGFIREHLDLQGHKIGYNLVKGPDLVGPPGDGGLAESWEIVCTNCKVAVPVFFQELVLQVPYLETRYAPKLKQKTQ